MVPMCGVTLVVKGFALVYEEIVGRGYNLISDWIFSMCGCSRVAALTFPFLRASSRES